MSYNNCIIKEKISYNNCEYTAQGNLQCSKKQPMSISNPPLTEQEQMQYLTANFQQRNEIKFQQTQQAAEQRLPQQLNRTMQASCKQIYNL